MDPADFSVGGIASTKLAPPGAIALPLVSFIIVPNHFLDFGPLIAAIEAQDYPRIEIIVVRPVSSESDESFAGQAEMNPRLRVVPLEGTLSPIERGMAGLRSANGEFIVFLDGDAVPRSNFASAHIQVHLASRHAVPLTLSDCTSTKTAGKERPAPVAYLSDGSLMPGGKTIRLSCIDDAAYATLSERTELVAPDAQGSIDSVAQGAMYRRFVLDLLHPIEPRTGIDTLDISLHYQPLCLLLGGAAMIDLILMADSDGRTIRNALPDEKHTTTADREKLRVWAANGSDFSTRIGAKRYWNGIAGLLRLPSDTKDATFSARITESMAGQIASLSVAFGEKQAIHQLDALLPRPTLLSVLRQHYGSRLPLRVHWALQSSPIRTMHEQIRIYLRARRIRRRQTRRTSA